MSQGIVLRWGGEVGAAQEAREYSREYRGLYTVLSKTDAIRCAFKGPFWSPVQNGWGGRQGPSREAGMQVRGEGDPKQEVETAGVGRRTSRGA